MTKGLKNEAAVVRLFRDHGMNIISLRRGKHWVVTASPAGSAIVTRYVLSISPSHFGTQRIIEADFRRATAERRTQ
jgi:uncharacterized protein with PhoU and TrkA domain